MHEGSYSFGRYRFLPRRRVLLHGESPVRVGARALDLLHALIERQGDLVSKSDLMRVAWPDTFVHESNLKVTIAALRRALPRDRAELPYIVTVPGRGYRFAAPVRFEPGSGPTATAGGGFDRTPQMPSVLVGRADDVAELTKRVSEQGIVTVVGPAGVGKTTVAVTAARQLVASYSDGFCFVDLAAISDPQLVCAAIASSLGSNANFVDLLAGIVESLRDSNKLIILDNCEHVLTSAALVAEHIHFALPQVGIIATSREPLRFRAESVYRLPPLRCPASDMKVDGRQVMTFSAAELFVARARETADYRLTDLDAPVIASICRRLDGIPLAIELAASRLKLSEPAALLQQLDHSFELLNFGPRTAPLRHQALQATLDWSYQLLSEVEATLLGHLSVFAGVFSLEDVLGVTRDFRASPGDIVACLENLVSKSLVSQTFADNRLYYRLLDATRSYAAERLRLAGERRRTCEAHANYLQQLFERAEAERDWRAREDWMATFGRHADDLRKAIDWAFGEGGAPETGLRLTCAAIPLWDELSSASESRDMTRIALDASKAIAHCDPVVQMKLATAYARSLQFAGRFGPETEAAFLESIRIAGRIGNTDYQLRSLWGLATLQSFAGRHRDALANLEKVGALAERTNNRSVTTALARFRHMIQFYHGDVVGAHEALTQLARQHHQLDVRPRISQADPYVVIRVSLAFVSWVRGDRLEAASIAQASVDGAKTIGHLISQVNALALAVIPIALWAQDLDVAEQHLALLTDNLNQRDLANWAPLASFFAGAIAHQRGDPDAINRMRVATDEILASNFLIRFPIYLGMLAEAALEQGATELARSSIADALAHAEHLEEVWCRPELLRILGRVEQRCGDKDRAEELFLRAMQTAEEAGAFSFQFRATLELANCWVEAERIADAAALLDQVCRQAPGDTPGKDISSARRLLERLRSDFQ